MKILLITEHAPYPPNNGTRVKIHNLVSCLRSYGELVCAYLSETEQSQELPAGSSLKGEYVVHRSREHNPVKRYLGHMVQVYSRKVEGLTEIHEIIERETPQVLWLECGYICNLIPSLKRHGLPIIYGSHNSQFKLDFERWRCGRDLLKKMKAAPMLPLLYMHENTYVRMADCVCCISRPDMDYYKQIVAPEKVAYMPYVYDHRGVEEVVAREADHPYVCMLGSLRAVQNYQAAVYALERLWPEISARHADLHLYIIGELPEQGSIESQKIQALVKKTQRVIVTGRVAKVVPYVKGSLVNIVPLTIGSGVRTKIIESAACGTAVVSTSIGAEGLPFVNGESIEIADVESDFVSKVVALVEDESRRKTLTGNAYKVFVEELSLSAGKHALDNILGKVIGGSYRG